MNNQRLNQIALDFVSGLRRLDDHKEPFIQHSVVTNINNIKVIVKALLS